MCPESCGKLLNVHEETTAVIAPSAPDVLIVELAGALGSVRFEEGVHDQTVRPLLGEDLPDVTAVDGLIVTGSDLSAHQDEQRPLVEAARDLLRHAVELGVPVLAIGSGAQALALACDGHVESVAPTGPESGLISVRMRPDATADPVLGGVVTGVGRDVLLPAAHRDAITELPEGAIWLASSNQYPFQAFRIGSALGVQFQPQAGIEDVAAWVAGNEVEAGAEPDQEASADDAGAWAEAADELATMRSAIFEAFAAEATDRAHIALR